MKQYEQCIQNDNNNNNNNKMENGGRDEGVPRETIQR